MSSAIKPDLSAVQQISLVALRTLIGWHFLYEGYYKLMLPGWTPSGAPLGSWSSAGYLRAASGPFASVFHRLAESGWTPWVDGAVKISLVLIGLSLMLGFFTRLGCWAALMLLVLFYLPVMPLTGTFQPGSEGTYLIVNKTLIEAVAVMVLLTFNTGKIAGLDLLWAGRRRVRTAKIDEGLAKV